MRILKQVDGSVLWLLGGTDAAAGANNLRKAAQARGVESSRLVFAQRIPLDEHLARYRLADLFIDTMSYNAHVTATDALWAGVPVLACMDQSFACRVGASLLRAIGLPELIAYTQEEFESMAVDLATHPNKLQVLKEKLQTNRLTTPLFDIKLLTWHLESALRLCMLAARQD